MCPLTPCARCPALHAQVLQGVLGVSTCGQLLAPASRCRLPLLFSEAAAGFFLEAALGLAPTRHGPKVWRVPRCTGALAR